MAHALAPLPYSNDALAPVISAETLGFHHGKHHARYVAQLNAALEGTGLEKAPIEELLLRIEELPQGKRTAVFNNGAQHFNHAFYWNCLSPNGGAPSAELARAIDVAFGSFEAFKEQFQAEAAKHFGSGWAWLVKGAGGGLKIVSTHDADTPLVHGLTPLFTADVWEHAYYIDYRNDRGAYLTALWKIANWEFVSKNFAG